MVRPLPSSTCTALRIPVSNLMTASSHLVGLPSTLPPAPSLKRNYNLQPPASSASTAPTEPIQHTNLSFLPPSAHKAYQALRSAHLNRPALPPLPARTRAPATTPSKPLDSFDLDGLFPTADDIMLLQTTAKPFGFGFHSFATETSTSTAVVDPNAVAVEGSSPSLPQPAYDFDTFFEDPTPNLDYSPLTSFSASPEWCPQPLFGQEGKEAGVVDDSPFVPRPYPHAVSRPTSAELAFAPVRLFAAEDSFDFDFSGPSLFGDAPLFPPAKTTTAAATESAMPTTTAAASAFAALEASLAHLPVNPALTLPKQQQEPTTTTTDFALHSTAPPLPPASALPPAAAPPSAVFSPAPAAAASHFFPPSPHRQTSSPFPSSTAVRPPPAARRATAAPTGHRKGVQPEQLLDLEAPTQARSYVAPSATSRKRLPAAFEGRGNSSKKRKSTTTTPEGPSTPAAAGPAAAVAGEDAEPPAELADSIEAKRRQNTLAARRSRIRKLEHVQNLERSVDRLEADKAELLRFAELAMRLHPELAAVDGWGARVAAVAAGPSAEDGTQPMPAWEGDD